MKSYISKGKDGLYIIVDRPKESETDYSFTKDFNFIDAQEEGGVAYPVIEDEIEAIYEACKEFLEERGDDVEE